MRVKPANPYAVIRDPHTKRPLPASGDDVPDNSFWRRRLRSGDVLLVSPVRNAPIAPLTTRQEG